ncbi:RNA polymerase sigma factor [Virgisporangium aurantiacum]
MALEREPVVPQADNELIRRSLTEPDAFAGIFDRHAATIHGYPARRPAHTPPDDVTAETFLVAFDRRGRFDLTQVDALPWLYGIATNLMHRWRRHEVRLYRALQRTGRDPVDDPDGDRVVARAAASAAHRRLAAVLARMPVGERDALLLLAWQDLSYAEIATALGIPVGTVRSRLNSARKRLRNALGDLDQKWS